MRPLHELYAQLRHGWCNDAHARVGRVRPDVLFTLASSNRCDNCLAECPFLAASIASHMDVYARRWMLEPAPAVAVKLSPRERLCLSWMAKGKRMSEIAPLSGRPFEAYSVRVLIGGRYRQGRSATNIGNCADLLPLMPYIAIH